MVNKRLIEEEGLILSSESLAYGKLNLALLLVSGGFGSKVSSSADFSLRVRKQRDRYDIYTVRCIDS